MLLIEEVSETVAVERIMKTKKRIKKINKRQKRVPAMKLGRCTRVFYMQG
jgi:hypothetical protein